VIICGFGLLIAIGLFGYYPIKALIIKATVRKQPTGWYLYPHPNDYFSLKGRERNEVVQWLQGMPVEYYPMGCRYESPYTFEEWLDNGAKIEGLEDTLLSLFVSRYRSLLRSGLSTALKQYGTQKSHDFFKDRLIQNEWTKEYQNEMYDILYGIIDNENEFLQLLEMIEEEKTIRLNDPNFMMM
jgi:hypothetical protein